MADWQLDDMLFDTATDAVAYLFNDGVYDGAQLENALNLRWDLAGSLANKLQDDWVATYGLDSALGEAAKDEVTLTVLMAQRSQDLPAGISWPTTWDYPVPLVVLSVDFAPHTQIPLPAGNVVVLDPTDEVSFLDSLVAAGFNTPRRTPENS